MPLPSILKWRAGRRPGVARNPARRMVPTEPCRIIERPRSVMASAASTTGNAPADNGRLNCVVGARQERLASWYVRVRVRRNDVWPMIFTSFSFNHTLAKWTGRNCSPRLLALKMCFLRPVQRSFKLNSGLELCR
jgi:hypothetical protein